MDITYISQNWLLSHINLFSCLEFILIIIGIFYVPGFKKF